MEFLKRISESFWNEKFWLPPNITWKDIEPGSKADITHADHRHFLWVIPISICIILIRYVIENYFLASLGKYLGVKSTRPKPPVYNKLLAEAYKNSQLLNPEVMKSVLKKCDWSERQVERWWRLRRAHDKPTILTKFCESGWRCIYYTFSFSIGIIILWDKPWLWEFKQVWNNYPHHSVSDGIWWYYMTGLGFYLSLTVSQLYDIKRKDFWQMFVHHIITLLLISLSWVCNFIRIGSLVLFVHDCADIPLEGAKCLKYANFQKLCEIATGVFIVLWIVTRLGIFSRIIYISTIDATEALKMFPGFAIFNSLLIMLLIMHLVWTYMIIKFFIHSLKVGKLEDDARSDSDADSTDSSISFNGGSET